MIPILDSRRLGAGMAVVALGVGLIAAGPALAGKPTALVEDMSGDVAGVRLMDYVDEGQTVQLGAGQTLSLSYLESCTVETITGGTVTIGVTESKVAGGSVDRKSAPCDKGKLKLSAQQSGAAGVSATRGGFKLGDAVRNPDFRLFRTSAVIVVPNPGKVVIERTDQAGEPQYSIDVTEHYIDLAKSSIRLVPGATYKVSMGDRNKLVVIDKSAGDEAGPAISRLIRL